MTLPRTLKIVLLAGLVSLVDPEAVIDGAGTDSFSAVTSAEAGVGRPLTAVSGAGVAPRTRPPPARAVPSAEAVVGRPLTPVSVAGVARRTGRRCAAGVYNCYSKPQEIRTLRFHLVQPPPDACASGLWCQARSTGLPRRRAMQNMLTTADGM